MNGLDVFSIFIRLIFAKLNEKIHELCVDIIVFLSHLFFSKESQGNYLLSRYFDAVCLETCML